VTALDQTYGHHFKILILLQITLSVFLPFSPRISIYFLLITYLLISLRFRGTFNGGSDSMTMTTLIGLALTQIPTSHDSLASIGMYFLAIHCTLSYFIAGIIKIKNPHWRSGFALQTFLIHSNYLVPSKIKLWARYPLFSICGSIIVIVFECSFPLIWLFPSLAGYYLFAGFVFHLINYFTFGLNRFVFAWLASYPTLLYCTLK
jgi:hypothetical protein